MSELKIEPMDLEGVTGAIAWAEAEGWQPGIGDAGPFFAADPGGYYRGVVGGETVSTISVVRGSPETAFVGLYIVDPGFRGRGFGRRLWDEALGRFAGTTLGLDAVPDQVSTYASEGFVPDYGNARYSIDAGQLPAPAETARTEPATSIDFDALAEFDARHFFGARPDFLRGWISGDGRNSVVTLDDGAVTGFSASRRTTAGHRIGPVFTAEPDLARQMILTLASGLEGPVAVDIPQPNRAAIELVDSLGMDRSFETTRMYRGPAPHLPLEQIFGITSLELG